MGKLFLAQLHSMLAKFCNEDLMAQLNQQGQDLLGLSIMSRYWDLVENFGMKQEAQAMFVQHGLAVMERVKWE